MKRLGVFLARWNNLKTLLPVMHAAHARGIHASVFCPFPPLTGSGKPELLAANIVPALRRRWPWAEWSILKQGPGSWLSVDAMIAHGVVHDADLIRKSGIPWVAVDHLHENMWWYLTGHEHFWDPFHKVCISGTEKKFAFLDNKALPTGYTALDGPWNRVEEDRATYGLPARYMLVGTAVRASGIQSSLWQAYFCRFPGFYKLISDYRGPSYGTILRVLKDYCLATGMAMVGKSRWKHEDHPAHGLFDHYFTDDPLDPHRAFRLMRGASAYAGGISGLAVEAMVARVPTLNWAYYSPILLDAPGFRALREDLWVNGIWTCPGIGRLWRVDQPGQWADFVDYMETFGPTMHYHPPAADETEARTIGYRGAADRVLAACGL